jgi:hypothetical protein
LDHRAELASWRPLVQDDEVDVKANIAFSITLDESGVPGVEGKSVEDLAERLIVGVEQVVAAVERSLT